MAEYAIGDVQGCFKSLMALLDKLNFDESRDRLWFVGDLVNRGPDSLGVLRFVSQLKIKPIVTLGNHDLHYLATSYTQPRHPLSTQDTHPFLQTPTVNPGHPPKHKNTIKSLEQDSLDELLNAPDESILRNWLRQQKLIYYDKTIDVVMVHAGIAPMWGLEQAIACAKEVENELSGDGFIQLFKEMYGNEPRIWCDALQGNERYRVIINYLTRMRYLYSDGSLNLTCKASPSSKIPADLIPWFKLHNAHWDDTRVIFGHWATLQGQVNMKNIYGIDTGCLWGGHLTALNIHSNTLTTVKNHDIEVSKQWKRN